MKQLSAVQLLTAEHDLTSFSCGKPALDEWLRRFALVNQTNDSARTYVAARGNVVVGYFSICAGSARPDEPPHRISRGLARHPVPVIILARLAVDTSCARQGLGAALLKDALVRIEAAAEILGARAVLVNALDDEARAFYEHFDFVASPTDAFQLFLLLKDLRKAVKR